MIIKVLAFGIAKDIFQNTFAEIEVANGFTVADLKLRLEKMYPGLKLLKSYMVAVNNEYAGGEKIISQNDEVAVIPPVSGG